MSEDSQKAGKSGKTKKARVLVATTIAGEPVQPNDVIAVDDATLKAHAEVLDADPAAVEYAESLKAAPAE